MEINRLLWKNLVKELRKRGRGEQESGAFLLGRLDSRIITDFICYDDLDPGCLGASIQFRSEGFEALWDYCSQNHLIVLADVHTHPGEWTGQSWSDSDNPMILQKGHVAIIVPYYAQWRRYSLKGINFYHYLGDRKWETITSHLPLRVNT